MLARILVAIAALLAVFLIGYGLGVARVEVDATEEAPTLECRRVAPNRVDCEVIPPARLDT